MYQITCNGIPMVNRDGTPMLVATAQRAREIVRILGAGFWYQRAVQGGDL